MEQPKQKKFKSPEVKDVRAACIPARVEQALEVLMRANTVGLDRAPKRRKGSAPDACHLRDLVAAATDFTCRFVPVS